MTFVRFAISNWRPLAIKNEPWSWLVSKNFNLTTYTTFPILQPPSHNLIAIPISNKNLHCSCSVHGKAPFLNLFFVLEVLRSICRNFGFHFCSLWLYIYQERPIWTWSPKEGGVLIQTTRHGTCFDSGAVIKLYVCVEKGGGLTQHWS